MCSSLVSPAPLPSRICVSAALKFILSQRRNDGSGLLAVTRPSSASRSCLAGITIHSQPMQPDPSSRHPVGGFPADENAILCKPLTELARKKLSDLPPGEEKPGNHDDQGDHNQAEQNPQTTTAARRWPRMRQEIAHAFFMLPPRATGPRLTECLSFIQKRPRASQGTAVRSVAASPAVLPRDAEDFEVVVAMRWEVGALERYLTANPETRTVMLQHVARDLAAKVERVTAASSKPLDKQR